MRYRDHGLWCRGLAGAILLAIPCRTWEELAESPRTATSDAQQEHWQVTFQANPDMYGTDPSKAGAYAVALFKEQQIREVVELGSGQGRDTLALLRAGLALP
jgi:hypothetical protein